MRRGMNEECFQIISGIVYPRIEFVARRYSAQRFGLSGHSRAPRGIRRRKHVIIRAIAQSQLVPTLEIQRPASIGPSRMAKYRVSSHCIKERWYSTRWYERTFFNRTKKTIFLRFVTKMVHPNGSVLILTWMKMWFNNVNYSINGWGIREI